MVNLTPSSLAPRTPTASSNNAESRSRDENRAYQVVAKAQKEAGVCTSPTSTPVATRAASTPSGRDLVSGSPKRLRSALGKVDTNVPRQSPSRKSGKSVAHTDDSSIPLSKCFPEDLLTLKRGDSVYIMCASSSEVYREICERLAFENRLVGERGSVDANDEYLMPREDYSSRTDNLYCFPGTVEVECDYSSGTNTGSYIRRQQEDATSPCLSVRLDSCVSVLPIPWNMVMDLSIEVWIPIKSRGGKNHDFCSALGRDPRDVSAIARPVERLLGEARGDPIQTLLITSSFYQKKVRIQGRKITKLENENDTLKASLTDPNYIEKLIEHAIEAEKEKAVAFVKYVDGMFLQAIQQHFDDWTYVKSPLLPVSFLHQVFQIFEQSFPRLYCTLQAFVFSERDSRPSSHGTNRLYRKQLRVLDMFIMMARTKSQFNAVHIAMCETFAYIGRGAKQVDMQSDVRRRTAVSMPHAFVFIRGMTKQARLCITYVLIREYSLSVSLDNHQQVRSIKAQRDKASSSTLEGTVRFARRNFAVPPTPGSRIRFFGANPPVDYIVEWAVPVPDSKGRFGYCYDIILRRVANIQEITMSSFPRPDCKVTQFAGTESVSLEYVNQEVPASPFMLKPRGMELQDVVFSSIPGIFDTARVTNQGQYERLNTSDYAKVVRRSNTLGNFRRFLSIPPKGRLKSLEEDDDDDAQVDASAAENEPEIMQAGTEEVPAAAEASESGASMNVDEETEDIFRKLRKTLLLGKQFPDRYVKSCNWTVEELTLLILLEMSKNEELSTEGMLKVLIEFLITLGRLSRDEFENLRAMPGIELTRTILYGDGLTNMRIRAVIARVKAKRAELGSEEYVANVLKALETLVEMPGDLHIPFHMLQAIYRVFYGGGIQVAQAILGWSRIQYDPVPRYQASQRLAVTMYEMLESVRLDKWKAGLARDRSDGGALLPLPTGVTFEDGSSIFTEVTLLDLDSFEDKDAAGILASSYEVYSDGLLQSADEVVRYWAEFHQMVESYMRYELSVRRGDSIMTELLAVDWLCYFKATGKSNYVETFLHMMETLYRDISAYELEEVRWNRFIRLSKGRGMIAMDDFCEIMNAWSKVMTNSADVDKLAEKSLFLSLFRRCMHMSDLLAGRDTTPSSSKPSRMANDRKALYDMFSELEVCTEKAGRVLPEDGAWSVFPKVKLQVEKNKNSSLRDEEYQKKLLEVFGSVSSMESAVPEEGEGESTAADVEDDDDDAGEIDDPEEAAALLKKMKKYSTERMALDGLLQSGAAKLENIKAERKEKQDREQHDDDIVAEAVREFMEENHDADDASEKSSMSWEDDWVQGTS